MCQWERRFGNSIGERRPLDQLKDESLDAVALFEAVNLRDLASGMELQMNGGRSLVLPGISPEPESAGWIVGGTALTKSVTETPERWPLRHPCSV